MITTDYHCPRCHRATVEMDLLDERYTPTADDLRSRSGMEPIAHELLRCPCGEVLTWFTLEAHTRYGGEIKVKITWWNPRWKALLRTVVWRRRRGRAAHLRRPRARLWLGRIANE